MKISVIIPAYNEEKNISRSIESLLNQTRRIDEIIVIDNNSTDGTAAVARAYGVNVLREKRQGMIPARDAGFNAATGDVIGRIDSDTIVNHRWAERIEVNFSDPNVVGLTGPVLYTDSRLTRLMDFSRPYLKMMKLISGHYMLMGPSMAIRAEVWKSVKDSVCGDDKIVHEDIDLAINISKFGRIVYDRQWRAETSARRIVGNPWSFFVEYPIRTFGTFKHNKRKMAA